MSVILLVVLCRAEEILLLSVGPKTGGPHQLVCTDNPAMPTRDPGLSLVIVESNVKMLARKSQSKSLLYYVAVDKCRAIIGTNWYNFLTNQVKLRINSLWNI